MASGTAQIYLFKSGIGTYHNGQNLGKQPVRILVVNIGAVGVENTVKKL